MQWEERDWNILQHLELLKESSKKRYCMGWYTESGEDQIVWRDMIANTKKEGQLSIWSYSSLYKNYKYL